jgi:hypothetical protein
VRLPILQTEPCTISNHLGSAFLQPACYFALPCLNVNLRVPADLGIGRNEFAFRERNCRLPACLCVLGPPPSV